MQSLLPWPRCLGCCFPIVLWGSLRVCPWVIMTAIEQPSVFLNILTVLERIEEKLEKQDRRFEHLENLAIAAKDTRNAHSSMNTLNAFDDPLVHSENHCYVGKHLEYRDLGLNRSLSKERLADNVSSGRNRPAPKVRNSDWSINWRNWDHDKEFMQMLQQRLGDYWRVPKDNRLPLKFFKSTIHSSEDYWGSQVAMYHAQKASVKTRLDQLHRFDSELRVHRGNDFLIIDYDLTNNTRIYRIGEAAIGNELMVDPGQSTSAPWSRLMYVSCNAHSGACLTNI